MLGFPVTASQPASPSSLPNASARSRGPRLALALLCALLLGSPTARLDEARAQTGQDATTADLSSGDVPLRASFDGGRGQIWLAPNSQGRRVGTSFVLQQGEALWSHPGAASSLGAPGVDLAIEHGGLVALRVEPGGKTTHVDTFVGRGTATLGGAARTLEPGTRYSVAGSAVETSPAPALPAGGWGALPWEPQVPDSAQYPGGFLGIVQLAVEGQPEPLLLDPSSIALDVTVDALTARIHARLQFPLDDAVPCCEDLLGVYQALLPTDALLHSISIDLGDELYDSSIERVTSREASGALGAMIEPRDLSRGTIARLPIGLWPVNADAGSIAVELEWTQPMHLSREGSLLLVPRAWTSRDIALDSLDIEVNVKGTDAGLVAVPPLTATDTGSYEVHATDLALDTGLAVYTAAPADTQRRWAGRTAGTDGVYFAIERPLPTRADADQPTDYLVLVDDSAGLGPEHATHARQVALGLVGSIADPTRDRVLVARLAGKPTAVTTGYESPDATLLDTLERELTGASQGIASLTDAIAFARKQANAHDEGRALQIITIGDLHPTRVTDETLTADLEAIAASGAGFLLVDVGAGDDPALTDLLHAWRFAALHAVAQRPAPLTLAAVRDALGQGLERSAVPQPTTRSVSVLTEQPTTSSVVVGPRLLMGRYQSPGPLFDLAGTVSVCELDNDSSGCETTIEADLTTARPTTGLGLLHTANALREQRTVGADATELAHLKLAGPDHELVVPRLQAAFDLEYLARRARGSTELQWLRRNPGRGQPSAGRAAWQTRALPLPDISSANPEFISATVQPLGRDPWLKTSPAAAPRPPTMAEVLAGQRSQGASPMMPDVTTTTEPTPGTVDYAVWSARMSSDYALGYARNSVFEELRNDPVKAEKYLVAWHDVSTRSTNQLYAVQSPLYTLGLQERATLANYDIQIIEPWAGDIQRKDAMRYFLDRKHWSRAERALLTGFERNPGDTFFSDGLVKVYEATGRNDQIADIEGEALVRQLAREPERRAAIEQHLARLVRSGHTRVARQALERWSENAGQSPTVYGLLARLESLAGNSERALTLLREGQAAFPDSRHALAMLFDGLIDAGRAGEALELGEQWLERDPYNAHLTQLVGDLQTREGKTAAALDTYAQLLELAPHAPLGYVKVGDALTALGRTDEAVTWFRHANALAPGDLATNLRLIDASSRSGDIEAAVEAFETVRAAGAFQSTDPEGYRVGEELYYQLLLRWRAEATWTGDDRQLETINAKLRQVYVDMGLFAYNQAAPSYALRLTFVPDTDDSDVLVDMRITEPGGNVVSYITPYNTALGSQLYAISGRSGTGPRTYFLPTATEGTFEVEIGHGGPPEHGPLRGQLFVHQLPAAFTEHWSRHDIVLERSGDTWRLPIVIDEATDGDAVAPQR